MAFIDSQNEYSVKQDLSQSTGTYPSTNVIDHGAANADVGHGEHGNADIKVEFKVDEAFDSSGDAATVEVQIQTSVDEAFTAPVILWRSGVLAQGVINAGLQPVKMPLGVLRYTRIAYVIAAAATTTGQMSAWISLASQRNRAYPTAIK